MQNLYRHQSTHQPQTRKVKHFKYAHDNRIGKGYSSVVYKGSNQLTDESVAIKAIDMKGVKDSASRQMLDCQIQALTKLKHQNVLKCHDVVREQSHCFIVTDLCDGGDLAALLKKKKTMSEKEVMRLTREIVSGFVHIAEGGFLHRDLKLANIFMKGNKAVIADFGFAKKHRNSSERERYNVGSPLYMSPEALKKNIYTVKNDIWSIGVIVYELLHGDTPWECRTQKQLMDKMVRIPVKFRQSLNLSPEIKQFIKKCLEVSEDKRMSLEDLKNWSRGNSIEPEQRRVSQVKHSKSSHQERAPALRQATGRVNNNSQNSTTLNSRPISNKNAPQEQSKNQRKGITKGAVDRNNTILIIEINTFRLLFKIYEKLQKLCPDQKELSSVIGNEVLRRVDTMSSFLNPDKENSQNSNSCNYGVAEGKLYLSEETNSSIKKYKSVVKEYHRKYHAQISNRPLGRQVSTKSLMKEALQNEQILHQGLTIDECVLVFWMLEFMKLDDRVTKEFIEGVIEVKKHSPTETYLRDRIEAL